MILFFYILLIMPIDMAFFENDSIILYAMSLFVNICYLIDIMISMFTAYY